MNRAIRLVGWFMFGFCIGSAAGYLLQGHLLYSGLMAILAGVNWETAHGRTIFGQRYKD